MKNYLLMCLCLAFVLTLASVASGQSATPEQSARSLWDAWAARDKSRAARFATPRVVSYIWKEKIAEYEFEGCDAHDGRQHCFFRHVSGGSINLTLRRFGRSWKATDALFYLG